MDFFPYENWLHDLFNGVGMKDLALQSPENWLRVALLELPAGDEPELPANTQPGLVGVGTPRDA